MLDHITFRVSNLAKSKEFYEKTLAKLGMSIVLGSEQEGYWGFGVEHEPYFEIAGATKERPAHKKLHVAFKAKDKKMVDDWYTASIEAGATDNGKPGLRPDYTPTYYAAFIKDMDENNIEVCLY